MDISRLDGGGPLDCYMKEQDNNHRGLDNQIPVSQQGNDQEQAGEKVQIPV
jgi:hypothetical protein